MSSGLMSSFSRSPSLSEHKEGVDRSPTVGGTETWEEVARGGGGGGISTEAGLVIEASVFAVVGRLGATDSETLRALVLVLSIRFLFSPVFTELGRVGTWEGSDGAEAEAPRDEYSDEREELLLRFLAEKLVSPA